MKHTIPTRKGYALMEVVSCLQKAIRRGDTPLAGYMALELFESRQWRYLWKRLLVISAEDCAGIVTQEIAALHDAFLLCTDQGRQHRSRIFISKAVIVLCQARKSRDADHLQNFIYDRDMIDAAKLEQALTEARETSEHVPLPDYTFDVHTRKGKHLGKTKDDFFRAEFLALRPREEGEFDWCLAPSNSKPHS